MQTTFAYLNTSAIRLEIIGYIGMPCWNQFDNEDINTGIISDKYNSSESLHLHITYHIALIK